MTGWQWQIKSKSNQINFIVQQLSDNFSIKINILNEWNKVTD